MPRPQSQRLRRICFFCVSLLIAGAGYARKPSANSPLEFLDRLQGRWVLHGIIGGKASTHDVQADWVLKHEYLRLHEVSRQKDAQGDPAYEAIVFLGWDAKTREYRCLWLDSTSGDGLSPQGIARGKRSGDSIPFLFTLSPGDSLHTTFVYERASDTWRWLIDDESKGKTVRFADVTLSRARQ